MNAMAGRWKYILRLSIATDFMIEVLPRTSVRLRILAPNMFPIERADAFFRRAVSAVTNSGRLVPRAVMVTPITMDGTFSDTAIFSP